MRQPIEGFRGSGEVIAYSSSRIFLQLNKDGEWPRQVQWEIRTKDQRLCSITFNKVGWQYTSSKDTCGLDWMRLDPNTYRYRLFVVESIPSPSETLPDRVAESLLLTRTPSTLPLTPVETKTQTGAKENGHSQSVTDSTAKHAQNVSTPIKPLDSDGQNQSKPTETSETSKSGKVPLTTSMPKSQDKLELRHSDTTLGVHKTELLTNPSEANSTVNKLLPELSNDNEVVSSVSRNTETEMMGVPVEEFAFEAQNELENPALLSKDELSSAPVNPNVLSADSTFSPATFDEKPDYIFTIPDYQPRRGRLRRKKMPTDREAKESSISPILQESEISKDLETSMNVGVSDFISAPATLVEPLLPKRNENDTSVYVQKAPFISVASFKTREYAQEVLDQFTCPGGCIIVRSEKGLYYRIGFYPDPKNISVDLPEIRKKYSDAWLVN